MDWARTSLSLQSLLSAYFITATGKEAKITCKQQNSCEKQNIWRMKNTLQYSELNENITSKFEKYSKVKLRKTKWKWTFLSIRSKIRSKISKLSIYPKKLEKANRRNLRTHHSRNKWNWIKEVNRKRVTKGLFVHIKKLNKVHKTLASKKKKKRRYKSLKLEMNNKEGPMRCLRGGKLLLPSLITRIQCPKPTW